jgi:hypothetical protein
VVLAERGRQAVGEPLKSQLCLTNEEMRKAFLAEVKAAIGRDEASARKAGVPPPQIYDISCNDCREPCQCTACQAVAKAEESESGPLIHFVNWMADELGKFRPGLYVSTLAYFHTHKPPKTVRPRDNVFIRLCDTDTNQAFVTRPGETALFQSGCKSGTRSRKTWPSGTTASPTALRRDCLSRTSTRSLTISPRSRRTA